MVAPASRWGVLEWLEVKTLDLRFRLLAQPERASPEVVLVAIDDKSLAFFKQHGIVWKWPRDLYAALVRYLSRGRARVIVFDMLFADPDVDRVNADAEETDGAFAEAMRQAGNVILAAHPNKKPDPAIRDNPLEYRSPFVLLPEEAAEHFGRNESGAELPIPLFQRSARALGAANYEEDPQDGVCRRLPLLFFHQGALFPHLGLAAHLLAKDETTIRILESGELQVGADRIPVDEKGRFLIYWYGRGGPGGCFRTYSIASVIASAIADEKGEAPLVPSSVFEDKIVIVGASATGLFDYRTTPFTSIEKYPAMEIYATVASNLAQGHFLRRVPPLIPVTMVFLLSLLVAFAFFHWKAIEKILAAAGLAGAGWLAAVLLLFRFGDLWVDLVAPEAGLLVAFGGCALFSYSVEGRERRKIRALFSRYVSPQVVSKILDKGDRVELGGEEVFATVYFSDIREFTSICERTAPADVVSLLNRYFSVATEKILDQKGLVDKYMGDGIMAIFGAPVPDREHASHACEAALAVQRAMKELGWLSDGDPRLALLTRIGIHSGPVVVGNVGSSLRMEYTAIGDTVNVASRLEGANKIFSTRILISESTRKEIGDRFVVRELDQIRVKGKQATILCFELVGASGEVPAETLGLLERFHEGLALYRARRFQEALGIYETLVARFPEDGPSRTFRDRCAELARHPPSEEEDGVISQEEK